MESGGPRGAGASLVDEIHEQRKRVEVERVAQRRRRVRRRVLGLVGALGVAATATVVGVELVQRHRIEERLSDAQGDLALASVLTLDRASQVLDRNLSVEPDHPESLGLLALVRVHQFAQGIVDVDAAQEAIDRAASADRPEASLAAGMLAGLQGDFDTARRAYEAELPTDEPGVANEVAWLRGITALGRPYDTQQVAAAVDHLRTELQRDPSWIPNRRVVAALLVRSHAYEEALQVLQEGRERDPTHLGLAVDEALVHAAMQRKLDGVETATREVLASPNIAATDQAYARLARGLAALHEGSEQAIEELETAWSALPTWDNHARDLVVDATLTAGEVAFAAERIGDVKLGPVGDEIYGAWLDLIRGDVPGALQRLSELPQDHPRVAHLQALGLAEQQRWEEATRWLDYASKRGLRRGDLEVAAARVALRNGDPTLALARLQAVADEHPRTHRVWTGLAEARIATQADPKAIDAALERALQDEAVPAEASWMQAERLATQAIDEPRRATDALAAYREAATKNPHLPRYASALGRYQAELGQLEDGEATLRELVDAEQADPEALLTLSRIVIEPARARGTAVPAEVEGWLAKATEAGADPWDVELEWARLLLARNDPGSVEQARSRAANVVQTRPKDIEARVVLARALIAQENYGDAKAVLRQGIRRTLRRIDGRLYVTLGEMELARGKKRRAASLAFQGWRKLAREPATGAELLEAAPLVSTLWLDLGQPRGALTVARELTERVPWSIDAWILRGDTQFLDGFVKEGCESAERALELDPKHPGAVALRGDCLTRTFDFDAARKEYKRAIALAEGTPEQRRYVRKLERL